MVAVGALTAMMVALAAGYGYAAITEGNNTYTGCLQNGTISNVAIGSAPAKACGRATPISWNQTGPPGQNGSNGTSVTSATEPQGLNCANGGSRFTAVNGVTYACNGAKGDHGDAGPANLAALEGSPCTIGGDPSTLDVSVDATSGAVTMICQIPDFDVSVTASGAMQFITIFDATKNQYTQCLDVSSCRRLVPRGNRVLIDLQSGNNLTGGGHPFTYTCPGVAGNIQATNPVSPDSWIGHCETQSLHADYPITVAFS